MSKKEDVNKIVELVRSMASNSYLLPDSWTNLIPLQSGGEYKTYVDGRVGSSLYVHIEYYIDGQQIFDLLVNGDKVRLNSVDIERVPSTARVLSAVEEIYQEKHSFIENNEGRKAILQKIADKKREMLAKKKELSALEKELEDFDLLATKEKP